MGCCCSEKIQGRRVGDIAIGIYTPVTLCIRKVALYADHRQIKKADADAAEKELVIFSAENQKRIVALEENITKSDSLMASQLNAMEKTKINGLAARMEALSRITSNSSAVTWAHWFIILLFIAIETAPVFVKLISSKGPYDNLLRIAEHGFIAQEIEETAQTNAQTKDRTSGLPQHEKNFVANSLDAELG